MQKCANIVELEKMLPTAYLLATIGFATGENEPAKKLQTSAKFAKFAPSPPSPAHDNHPEVQLKHVEELMRRYGTEDQVTGVDVPDYAFFELQVRKIRAKFCKFLAGSFSAVSKRNFARKYAFDSIF